MTLDDLRRLDPNNIGSWPAPIKLGVLLIALVAIIVASYFLDWRNQIQSVDVAAQKEASLKDTFIEKKKVAINLDAYRDQLAEIQKSFDVLLKQLPGKAEMASLLTDINQAGLGRNLQFELFKPAQTENMNEFYAELPIQIRVTGGYHDIGAFASDISKLSRIVLLSDIALVPNKDGNLSMDATARTYRYLDDDEIAQQKKTTKGNKKK